MSCEVHVNDIGTAFRITIRDCNNTPIDISNAITKEIIFKKPDKTALTKPVTFYTTGSDGIVEYITVDGDLSIKGKWKLQVKVQLATGTWRSNVEEFEVFENI